jgi:hypothetical protein
MHETLKHMQYVTDAVFVTTMLLFAGNMIGAAHQ